MEGGIAISTGEAVIISGTLHGIKLPKKIDLRKCLAAHACLFFSWRLETALDIFFPVSPFYSS
jgi:hypothetical protein